MIEHVPRKKGKRRKNIPKKTVKSNPHRSPRDRERISILGAGPSGLSAAISLARAGWTVEVFEKRHRVGERFSGDLQGMENWSNKIDVTKRLRKMGIQANFDLDPFNQLTLTNISREVVFSLDKPAFYIVKRGPLPGTLDHGLAEQAMDLGVCIHHGKTKPEDKVDIIATGPLPGKAFGAIKGITFQTSMNDQVIAILGDTVAYRGYAYLLVTGGQGCLCTMVMGRFDKVQSCLQRAKKAFSEIIDLDIKNPRETAGIGTFSATTTPEREGRLYVGEAAGIQDLLWGFGIDKALTSGYLAAQSLIHNQNYERTLNKLLGNKLKANMTNRFLWEALHLDDYSLIIGLLGHVNDPIKLLHRTHNHNPLHQSLYPLAKSYLKKHYPNLF